jgi:hypothetical protein
MLQSTRSESVMSGRNPNGHYQPVHCSVDMGPGGYQASSLPALQRRESPPRLARLACEPWL